MSIKLNKLSFFTSTPKKNSIAPNQNRSQHLLHSAVLEEDVSILSSLLDLVPADTRACTREFNVAFATDLDHLRYTKSFLKDPPNNNNSNNNKNNNKNSVIDESAIFPKKTTTCLHLTAKLGDVRKAAVLLDRGAEVNARMEDGVTALMVAASHSRVEVAQLLLDWGAEVNDQALWGRTALHYAVQTQELTLAQILLQNRADPNLEDWEGLTTLHLAAKLGRADMTLLLTDFGADVCRRSRRGATPMHFAVAMGWDEVVEVLLLRGAMIEVVLKADGELDLDMFPWQSECQVKRRVEMVRKYVQMVREIGWRSRMLVKLGNVARSAFGFLDETF